MPAGALIAADGHAERPALRSREVQDPTGTDDAGVFRCAPLGGGAAGRERGIGIPAGERPPP